MTEFDDAKSDGLKQQESGSSENEQTLTKDDGQMVEELQTYEMTSDERLEQKRYECKLAVLEQCECTAPVTRKCQRRHSKDFSRTMHILCDSCDGVVESYRIDELQERVLLLSPGLDLNGPNPFVEIQVNKSPFGSQFEDGDEYMVDIASEFRIMPCGDLRVLIDPVVSAEDAAEMLRRVADRVDRSGLDEKRDWDTLNYEEWQKDQQKFLPPRHRSSDPGPPTRSQSCDGGS